MPVITHYIAGISFRTEWNTWLPVLQAYNFAKFQSAGITPDVHHCVYEARWEDMTVPSLTQGEQEVLSRFVRCSGDLDSPLFCLPLVREKVELCRDQEGMVDLFVSRDLIVFRDFNKRKIDLFYTPEFGG